MATKIKMHSGSLQVSFFDFGILTNFIANNMRTLLHEDHPDTQRLVYSYLLSRFVISNNSIADFETSFFRPSFYWDLNIILGAKTLKATEPRDKVYAMLFAFSKDEIRWKHETREKHASLFKIDYAKPVDDIYTEFTALLLDRLEWEWKCWPLCFANGRTGKSNSSLPSWVPNWGENDFNHNVYAFALSLLSIAQRKRKTSKQGKALRFRVDRRRLHVWGLRKANVLASFRLPKLNPGAQRIDAMDIDEVEGLKMSAMRVLEMVFQFPPGHGNSESNKALALQSLAKCVYSLNGIDPMNFESRQPEWKSKEIELSSALDIQPAVLRIRVIMELLNIKTEANTEALSSSDLWLHESRKVLSAYLSDAEIDICLRTAQTRMQGGLMNLANGEPEQQMAYLLCLVDGLANYIDCNSLLVEFVLRHHGKTLFQASDGRIGIGFDIEPNDVISLWDGLQLPMAIRPSSNDQGQESGWMLSGPIYIDGLINNGAERGGTVYEELIII